MRKDPLLMITLCVTTSVMTFALIFAYINFTPRSYVNAEQNLLYEFSAPEEHVRQILTLDQSIPAVESITLTSSLKENVPRRLVNEEQADPYAMEKFTQIPLTFAGDNINYPYQHFVHRTGSIDFSDVQDKKNLLFITGFESDLELAKDGVWIGDEKYEIIGQAMAGFSSFQTTAAGFLNLLPNLEQFTVIVRTNKPLNNVEDKQLTDLFEGIGLTIKASPSEGNRQAALDSISQMMITFLFYGICFLSFLSLLGELLDRQKNRHRAALLLGASPKSLSSLVVQIIMIFGTVFSGVATLLYALFYNSFFQRLNRRDQIIIKWQEFLLLFIFTVLFTLIAAKIFAYFYTKKRTKQLLQKA